MAVFVTIEVRLAGIKTETGKHLLSFVLLAESRASRVNGRVWNTSGVTSTSRDWKHFSESINTD
jgi:hypothetical protein